MMSIQTVLADLQGEVRGLTERLTRLEKNFKLLPVGHVIYPYELEGLESEGWIPHTVNECPVHPKTEVLIKVRGVGNQLPATADGYYWDNYGMNSISHYKITKPYIEPKLKAAIASWGDDAALYQSRLGVKHDGQVTFERWFVCSKSQYDYHVHNKGADNNWVYEARKLYTHPAPKQVPMSDEELATLKHRAALYEHIRKFNPVKFNEFYSRNIKGGGAFDDLVYQDLVKEQSL